MLTTCCCFPYNGCIVFSSSTINNVGRDIIRIATKTKWPPHWIYMYYASINYIFAKTWSSALLKAYLWSTNDNNASWTVNGHQGPRQGTKLARGKIANVIIILLLILVKKFIPRQLIHGCRYCSRNNTNELRLLISMCFWVKKRIDWRTNQFKKQQYTGSN